MQACRPQRFTCCLDQRFGIVGNKSIDMEVSTRACFNFSDILHSCMFETKFSGKMELFR